MAGVESLRFCIPFSYRAMYKCLLIIIIIKICLIYNSNLERDSGLSTPSEPPVMSSFRLAITITSLNFK